MKRLSHLTLVLALVSVFQILDIQANPVESGSAIQEDVPPVVAYMREVGQSLRQMRRQLTPDKQEENLKLVNEIRENLEKARGEEPLKTPEIPAQERDAFLKGYKELLSKSLTTINKLEVSLSEGDLDQAQELLVALNDIRKEGHGKYQKEE
jgi:soluble cytochrome b562